MTNQMNKATKLIFWQRITIGVLLLVSVFSMWQAHLCRQMRDKNWQKVQYLLDALHKNDEENWKVIADLDKQIKRYEKQYGPLPRQDKVLPKGKVIAADGVMEQ